VQTQYFYPAPTPIDVPNHHLPFQYQPAMSRRLIKDARALSAALSKLDNLKADEYIVAFGARSEHFYGSPNGYHA
jgi:hypothetical protein